MPRCRPGELDRSCWRLYDLSRAEVPEDLNGYTLLDFSENYLSGRGLAQVLELCRRCNSLEAVKLHKNDLTDDDVDELVEFLEEKKPFNELHLSHNYFSREGAEAIVKAASRRDRGPRPFWLRLERNPIGDTSEFLKDMESRCGVCPIRPNCVPRRCCVGSRVHMPFLDMARERRERLSGRWRRAQLRPASPGRLRLVPVAGDPYDDEDGDRYRDDSRSSSRSSTPPHHRRSRSRHAPDQSGERAAHRVVRLMPAVERRVREAVAAQPIQQPSKIEVFQKRLEALLTAHPLPPREQAEPEPP